MANNYNLRYNFIDVCTPDYLQDLHQREGEQLIAIVPYKGMTARELADELSWEVINGGIYDELWSVLPEDDEQAQVLVKQLVIDEVSDWQLRYEDLEDLDDLMVYGYFSWDSSS